ncbi:MAG TPA: VWA domain-containing protein [Cyclobacteriaceae bacterium]|jgi:hypothetical protein|nr:VWA domain-containing protein [Cyclobacteriaceae bacterium]
MSNKFYLILIVQLLIVELSYSQPTLSVQYSAGGTVTSPMLFGNIETLLHSRKKIKISNTGVIGGNLNVAINIIPTGLGVDNSAYWSLSLPATPGVALALPYNLSLPPGSAPSELLVNFNPTAAAPLGADLTMVLAMTTNGSPATANFNIVGQAQKAPINFAMVLDKSGSMDQIVTGSTKRIDLLKTASKYFVDLLVARNNTNDKLAAIAYSTTAITPPLISKGPLNATSARSAIDGLSALGSTATGAGLEAANTEVGAAPVGGKNVTILFTDGEENVGPPWMTGANTANSSQVFTIGMGSLVTSSFQVALSNYAVAKNGTYYYVPETTVYSSSALPIDLQKAYLSVFTDASGMQGVVDPVYQVQLDGTEKLVGSAWITSSDHKILFSAFNEPTRGQAYDLEIRSPKGTVLANGVFGSAMEGKIIAGEGYFIYTADFSNVTDETEFVGKWDLYLKPKEKVSEKKEVVNIGFAATSFSDLQLQIGLGSTNYTPGNALNIALDLTEAGLSITSIKELFVKLTTPSGNQIILKPVLDSFGKLVTSYPHTYEAGTYQLFVRATIANSKGQVTTREQTKYYAFGYPPTVNSNPPCLSCSWIKIIIGITILLLLLILILALRRKK